MKRFMALALTTVFLFAGTAVAAEKKVTLKLATGTSVPANEASKKVKELIEKATDGSIVVTHFPDNMLGDDRVLSEQTIFGDIDIAVTSTSNMATMFPDFYIFDAPFLFLTPEDAYAALDGDVGQQILKGMEKKGIKGITFWENGFRNFTNNKVAAKLPADIKGMKIRTMENEVHLAAWKAFGANPTPMAFTELFTALQQGTVDGQENPLGLIDVNKFYEVQKYISLTEHVYTPYAVYMNMDKFNSLSKAQQETLVNAFTEVTPWQRERSQAMDKDVLKRIEGKCVVTYPTPEDKKVWQGLVQDAKVFDIVKKKMDNPKYLDAVLAK